MTDPATTTPDVIGDTARWLKSHDWAYWAIIGGGVLGMVAVIAYLWVTRKPAKTEVATT